MNMRPTLKDVGVAAGVSVYVASRALRGESGVAASTRARVERAASELGYVRNEMAAGLRKKNSHTVGILTASGRNQYYSMLAQVIDSTLREYGYYAVVSDMLKDRAGMGESEEQSLRLLFEQRPAAIVATYALSKSALKIIESFHVPVVFVDSPSAVAGEWPFVGSDNRQAGKIAGDYLGSLGHKNIAAVSYPSSWPTCKARITGLREAAERCGADVTVVECDNNPESAYENMSRKLQESDGSSRCDAVFALNTMMAMGSFRALQENGFHIGRDISLIAMDDFDWAPMLTPPLTVISQNMDEIGRQAGRFVVDAIRGNALAGQNLIIPVRLIERRSCVNWNENTERSS